MLAKRGAVNVGVDDDGHVEAAAQSGREIRPRPSGLRRRENPAERRGSRVEIERTEGCNSKRGDRTVSAEELDHVSDRLVGARRRQRQLRTNLTRRRADRAQGLRASQFEAPHHIDHPGVVAPSVSLIWH
jgi:hypothetical protein